MCETFINYQYKPNHTYCLKIYLVDNYGVISKYYLLTVYGWLWGFEYFGAVTLAKQKKLLM